MVIFLAGSRSKLLSIQIEPCDSDPCVLKKGTNAKVHFELIPGEVFTFGRRHKEQEERVPQRQFRVFHCMRNRAVFPAHFILLSDYLPRSINCRDVRSGLKGGRISLLTWFNLPGGPSLLVRDMPAKLEGRSGSTP